MTKTYEVDLVDAPIAMEVTQDVKLGDVLAFLDDTGVCAFTDFEDIIIADEGEEVDVNDSWLVRIGDDVGVYDQRQFSQMFRIR